MRISDWSSDVCSSDLPLGGRPDAGPAAPTIGAFLQLPVDAVDDPRVSLADIHLVEVDRAAGAVRELRPGLPAVPGNDEAAIPAAGRVPAGVKHIRVRRMRAEAHEVVLRPSNLLRDTIGTDGEKDVVGGQVEAIGIARIDRKRT